MESSEHALESKDATPARSKEAAALATLSSNPIPPIRPRRVRRRRRSLRRRLIDSVMPFAVLVGLTAFAAGLVSIVEIGAARNSKVKSVYNGEVTSYAPIPDTNFEAAQEQYRQLMRKHAEMKAQKPKKMNQVAYELGLANEAMRDLSGLNKVIPPPPPTTGKDDIMDWSLFEAGSEDPRSTLQRSGQSPSTATR